MQAALTAARAATAAARKNERQLCERVAALEAMLADSKSAERAARGRAAGMLDAMRRSQSEKQKAAREAASAKDRANAQRRALKALQAKVATLEQSLAKVRLQAWRRRCFADVLAILRQLSLPQQAATRTHGRISPCCMPQSVA